MKKSDKQRITDELMKAFQANPDEQGYDEYRACLRKQKYPAEEAVKQALQLNIFSYECEFCHNWHLTHLEKFGARRP